MTAIEREVGSDPLDRRTVDTGAGSHEGPNPDGAGGRVTCRPEGCPVAHHSTPID